MAFKWKKHCFICNRICSNSTHSEPWSLCDLKHKDKPKSTRDKILKLIHSKTDERSLAIKRRVSSCSDLPAVDARYHVACRRKLGLDSITPSNSAIRCKPQNRMQADNFEKLCQWFERECNLNTVAELFEKMKEFANNPNNPNQLYASPQYLKNMLKERYGDHVFFSEFLGKSNVVCFKNNASEVLTDAWYEERKSNAEEESQRIIKTAAKLIVMEMRSCNPDSSTYPTNEVIGSMKSNKECMPLLLQTLLESLLNNTLRQASIGQAIVYAARPRSALPPILFGLSVEIDHLFGSKWLLTQLNRLGFCLSVEEVLRFKQSVVVNENIDDLLKVVSNGSFSQWSADNVDHNVRSIDGKGSLHGMGIIISTTGCNTEQFTVGLPPIPREKRLNSNDIAAEHMISIKEYAHPDVAGLSKLRFHKVKALTASQPPDINLDLL